MYRMILFVKNTICVLQIKCKGIQKSENTPTFSNDIKGIFFLLFTLFAAIFIWMSYITFVKDIFQ